MIYLLSSASLVFTLLFAGTAFAASDCSPYQCNDGTEIARCSPEGYVINYFAAPCHTHGGERGSGDFSDVPFDHPNADAIRYVRDSGIVSGYPDSTYRPDAAINRAEFTKIIIGSNFTDRALGFCVDFGFSDTSRTAWYAKFICLAKQHEIIEGYSDGSFRPDTSINFVEAAKIIATVDNFYLNGVRYNNTPSQYGILGPPLPASIDGHWYEPFVRYLSNKNAIPTSVSSLDQQITRGEMAEIIYRLKTDNTSKSSRTYDQMAGQTTEGWKRFNSQHFNLSFDVPEDFTVEDEPNLIQIAAPQPPPGLFETPIYFMQLWRYTYLETMKGEIEDMRDELKNIVEDSVIVDGAPFVRITGNAFATINGQVKIIPGKVSHVFFEKSKLTIFSTVSLTDNQDAFALADKILASMKFSSTNK